MDWTFDQAPNVACISDESVIGGQPVLVVTHYDDDHSWAFLSEQVFHPAQALIVAMSTVIEAHPELNEIADLPPGWTATRGSVGEPWSKQRDNFDAQV